jgi:hypothetical protein
MEDMEHTFGSVQVDSHMIAPTEDNFSRLARAVIEKDNCSYAEALQKLGQLRLNLFCGDEIRSSVALQAALLTAINAGKRAFLGGTHVSMPAAVKPLVPWPTEDSLNEIVVKLGAVAESPSLSSLSHSLYFGKTPAPVANGLAIFCTGWVGGVAPADQEVVLPGEDDFATGGVLAGALGVAKGFLRVTGLSTRFVTEPQGVSLWRPDLHWLDKEAAGPALEILPMGVWFLGLGHLGQAFAWNFGLLPYAPTNPAKFVLQDFDRIVEANWSAGLLCDADSLGKYKTRICSEWLEQRGFETKIVERAFDETTQRAADEPFIALCGFDNLESRRLLEGAGFDLVVECGLGGGTGDFDDILLHTFPDASESAAQIWDNGDGNQLPKMSETLARAFEADEDCGILLQTLGQKAISSSFVGAYAGAWVVGELLRGLHGGTRIEFLKTKLRSNDDFGVVLKQEPYLNRFARSGYVQRHTKATNRSVKPQETL